MSGYKGRFLSIEEVTMPTGHVREVVRKQAAVAILAYDSERNEVAFVRQQRAPMMSPENPQGYVFEVPAGHIEARELPETAAARELLEETGISVRSDQVELLLDSMWLAVSPGWTDEKAWLAYVEIEPGQRNTTGNVFGEAQEGERTEVFWTPVEELDGMRFDDLKTFALVQWFLAKRSAREVCALREQLRRINEVAREIEAEIGWTI